MAPKAGFSRRSDNVASSNTNWVNRGRTRVLKGDYSMSLKLQPPAFLVLLFLRFSST